MAGLGQLDRLTDEESADLLSRVERFQSAWKPDGSTGLEWYLPAPGTRHRPLVLVQIVLADMERRAPVGLPFRVERYVNLFPEELSTNDVPVLLLATEFRLRHRYTDRPPIAEYQRWFPNQFDAMVVQLAQLPPLPSSAGDRTPVTAVNGLFEPNSTPGVPRLSTLNDGRPSTPPRPPAQLLATGPVNAAELAAANAAANADRARVPEAADMLPSDTPYQLIRRIGSGAFGEVFEALAPGGVRVAIKRILRSVDHPASQSEKEALDAIRELSHPFLLKTSAYWVFHDKLVVVMELADGSLTDRIAYHQERGLPGVPPEELITFFEQAGQALDYLHEQNVSHRDIKPENLLLMKGFAKVADFGLARIHEHTMTLVPNTVGTPAFMAPEMWQQRVSLQSDQYSLAATYVRARLGRHLFATNVLVDMANFHIHATPNLDPLPKPEQEVLLKALAKKPEDRYETCLEFAQALRLAVFPPPPPPPIPEPIREGGMNARALVFVAIACALASALAVGLVIRAMLPGPQVATTEKEKEKEREKEKGKDNNGNGKQPVVEPPKKNHPNYPTGWNPDEKEGTHFISGKDYHKRLTRQSGDRTLTALLIHATEGADIAPFYMLEDKITNKVFATEWELALKLPDRKAQDLIKNGLAFDRWKLTHDNKEEFDPNEEYADVPVLGVTLPQALLIAGRLGGKLPTVQQWQKAMGVWEEDVTSGPAGPPLTPPEEFEKLSPQEWDKVGVNWQRHLLFSVFAGLSTNERRGIVAKWQRDQYRKMDLALGFPAQVLAIPVTARRTKRDLSEHWEIRQLVTNGKEWLAHDDPKAPRIGLIPPPVNEQSACVVGSEASELNIKSLTGLRETPGAYRIADPEGPRVGFRIVLEVNP